MTISTTTIKNSYSGNGSTTTFNYTFKITDQDDIDVLIRSASGTETTKTITTHYTVTGVGNASGGTVVFTSGNIPSGTETVVLRRSTPQTQGVNLIENDFRFKLMSAIKRCVEFVPISIDATEIFFFGKSLGSLFFIIFFRVNSFPKH